MINVTIFALIAIINGLIIDRIGYLTGKILEESEGLGMKGKQ